MFAERCRSRDDELSPHPELGPRIENIPWRGARRKARTRVLTILLYPYIDVSNVSDGFVKIQTQGIS